MSRQSSQQSVPTNRQKLLEEKRAVYRRFLSLTETLREKVSALATADVEGLVASRQDCIAQIESLDSELKALKKEPKTALREEADEIAESVNREVYDIARKIMNFDESIVDTLSKARLDVQNRISAFTARKNNFQGYQSSGGRNARILNMQT